MTDRLETNLYGERPGLQPEELMSVIKTIYLPLDDQFLRLERKGISCRLAMSHNLMRPCVAP